MVVVAISGALFLVAITILQPNDQNLTTILGRIAKKLDDNLANISVLHKFKVSGESKVIAIVNVSNNAGLDYLTQRLLSVGQLAIDCQPVITYENFARNLGVSNELTEPSTVVLRKDDNLYWLTIHVDYFGNKTSEILPIWKVTAAGYLAAMKSGAIRAVFYKSLAEREVQMFWHVPNREQLDLEAFNCPLIINFGSNIRVESKGISFLDQNKAKE